MKYNIGYALKKTQTVIEFDESAFIQAVSVTHPECPIEYNQVFVGNEITEYATIVMTATSETFKRRVSEVADIYNIKPQIIQNGGTEALYIFSRKVNKNMFHKIATVLERLLQADHKTYRTYGCSDVYTAPDNNVLDVSKVIAIGKWIHDRDNISISDVRNDPLLPIVASLDVREVVEKIDTNQKYDPFIGLVIGHGSVFTYVMNHLKSIDLAYKFFNEHFDIGFECDMYSVDQYLNDGVALNAVGIIEDNGGYSSISDNGKHINISDFIIKVHYKLMRKDGSISYIVSLIGKDREVKHIEWLLTYSAQKLAESISKYGNFHVNPIPSAVKLLHELVSSTPVPEIHAFNTYGRNVYNGSEIIIYGDYVYDVTHKKAYPKSEGSNFYFFDNINGITVESRHNKSMTSIIGDDVVKLGNVHRTVTYQDLYDITSSIYKDSSAHMILLFALSMVAYAAYKPISENPVYFVTGVTGTGKSTFSAILMSIFGIKKPVNIETTTVLPLLMDLVAYDSLPVFYTEFRTKMNYAAEKTGIIKAVFDQGVFSRGKRDMTVDRYVFSSTVFIEGEELPKSGATRTRSLVHTTKHIGRKEGVNTLTIRETMKQNEQLLTALQYSFLDTVTKEKYLEAYHEGQKLYMTRNDIEPRILSNISLLYAAGISFAPTHKEQIQKVLSDMLDAQINDFKEHGTAEDIIKHITKYVGYKFANVYLKNFDVIFQWSDIEEYVAKNKLDLELSIDTYKMHLEAKGFELGYFEVDSKDEFDPGEMLVHGIKIHIGKCPKDLFCNKHIYKLFLDYEKYKVPTANR